MKIKLKITLFGLAIGILAVLAMGSSSPSTNPLGRYQTAAGFGFFMTIDTATGQAWLANVASPGLKGVPSDYLEKRIEKFPIGTTDSPAPVGRYQVTGSSGFFMITDTATGQNWIANASDPGVTGYRAGFFEKKTD